MEREKGRNIYSLSSVSLLSTLPRLCCSQRWSPTAWGGNRTKNKEDWGQIYMKNVYIYLYVTVTVMYLHLKCTTIILFSACKQQRRISSLKQIPTNGTSTTNNPRTFIFKSRRWWEGSEKGALPRHKSRGCHSNPSDVTHKPYPNYWIKTQFVS